MNQTEEIETTTEMMEETTEMDEIETTTELVSTTVEPSPTTELPTTETPTTTTELPTTTTELPITSTTEEVTTTEDSSQNTTPTYIVKFTPPTTTNSDIEEMIDSTTDQTTTDQTTTEETTTEEIESTTEEVTTVRPTARAKRGRSRFKRNNKMRIPRSPMAYEISAYDETPAYFGFQASPNPGPQPDIIDYETKLTPVPDSDSKDDVFNHFFYLTHYETIQVPYKFYNTIMRFTYVEAIRTSVLELELDSDNYNLMIFLPDYDYGLDNLLAAMKSNFVPSLRDIKKSMKQEWVKAIVPKFNLKGNIILTSDLQNVSLTVFIFGFLKF